MQLMIRKNERGFKDYYDWDMEDKETVIVHVNEVTQNSRGSWFIKADYNGDKFYANISPEDGNYLKAGNKYMMTCTGHDGKFKYLQFSMVKPQAGNERTTGNKQEPPHLLDESQIAMMFNTPTPMEVETHPNEPEANGNVQTMLPTSNTTDKECSDYLYKHKKELETQKYHIDKELGVINKLIMKTC